MCRKAIRKSQKQSPVDKCWKSTMCIVWFQLPERAWSQYEQMRLYIAVKLAHVFSHLVEQRFCYIDTLIRIVFELNDYAW